ncbi:glutamyl-tRNA amidotransferase [Mycolicibacterium lacusdiani]|uniref:glutamyl-tRNA amidotransferase n=1 Tax=Mycolicibacterium lacusdiani TaxID=2895283 RepID=UPI001F43C4C4|nr:glutamyl-tRNA amidotransferase [Mycolicibacterium lacusdiani]
MTEPATTWRETLRAQLLTARKDRDQTRVSALRSALSAIDNAETPDADTPAETTPVVTPDGAIAGATSGLASTEVARRQLTDSEIRALLRGEIDERLRAAEQLADNGAGDRAAAVRSEADVLTAVLAAG